MNLAPGEIFEQRYEVRSELGGGEFSAVYRATSMDTGRDVVIRILLPPPAAGYPTGFENRFMAEAKRVSKLRHAGTVQLESYGAAPDGELYLVTEYVSGHSLAAVLEKEVVTVQDALGLTKRMAESLGEANGRGVFHRELKPGNIAIPLRRGVLGAKLRDYGITKYVEQDGPISAAAVGFGSPRYMSPEQILGKDVCIASNIYSLGLVLYELLVGAPCVAATSAREILSAHLSTTDFEIPSTVPSAIRPVLKKMIAKSLADRYETTEELLDGLADAKRSGSGLIRLKVAKMVEALEASDDDGTNAADTIVDPSFVEPPTSEKTNERFVEDKTAERKSSRQEVLTPTNVVADDVTELSEDRAAAPTSVGDASENEPTDELEDKTKPAEKKRRPTEDGERKREPGEKRERRDRDGKRERSRDGKPRSSRSKSRSSRSKSSRSGRSSKSKSSRKPGEERSRRKPEEREEDRVSMWAAVAWIVGAVVVGLTLAGGLLYWRSPSAESRRTRASIALTQQPTTDPILDPSASVVIPSVALDLGQAAMVDLGEVPTGCGAERPTGWGVQTQVVGLTKVGYQAYVPSNYTGTKPVPLILAAHPPGMYGRQWVEHVRLTQVAEKLGAVLLAPVDKDVRPWMRDLPAAKAEFERVLDHATATFCIDLGRVVGVGMSSGAQALSLFSCDQPDRFRALGLVAHWVSPHTKCDDRRQPATFVVNGLLDRVSPVEGGGGCYNMDTRYSLSEAGERLRKQHGCGEEATPWPTGSAPEDDPDGDCRQYPSCDSAVVMCEVPNGVHAWPGSQHSVVRCLDELGEIPQLTSFPATDKLAEFLSEELAR